MSKLPAVRSRARRGLRGPARRVLQLLTADQVFRRRGGVRLWQQILGGRGLAEESRVQLARVTAQRLTALGDPAAARSMLKAAAGRVCTPTARADLAGTAAQSALAAGVVPDDLSQVLSLLTAEAEREFTAGRPGAAVPWLSRALDVAFHRTIHFDSSDSPLASHPDSYLQSLRESTVFPYLSRWRGRSQPAKHPPADRPQRILFVSFKNWNFLDGLLTALSNDPHVEFRRLDIADVAPGATPLSPTQLTRLRLCEPPDLTTQSWVTGIQEELDWADLIWIEWCQRSAVLLSTLDPGSARVVVRLHSFEAFSLFPHLVDWSRVDDLVFVAPHVKSFVQRVVPSLDTSGGPQLKILSNYANLGRFRKEKFPQARFTMGLVGWGNITKDPLWAVEVLAKLRRLDQRWRLVLVGNGFPLEGASHASRAYRQRLEDRVAQSDVVDAVEQFPYTADVPAALQQIGVIVSSSVRESFHLGAIEGAASGAVPIIRDWPMFTSFGGARSLFPAEWVMPSMDSAVSAVRAATRTEEVWELCGQAASEHVMKTFDWSATRSPYEEFLFGQ